MITWQWFISHGSWVWAWVAFVFIVFILIILSVLTRTIKKIYRPTNRRIRRKANR